MTNKTPAALLAAEQLVKMAVADKSPVFPTIDAAYREPIPLADFGKRIGALATPEDFVRDVPKLLSDMAKRIADLEAGMMPFATHALMLANMQMCLVAAGRGDEPAGGMWMNGLQNSSLQANPGVFYLAADILGRKRTEERMMEIFQGIQRSQEGAAERDKHVEAAKLQGPIGGPVSGQTH